METPAPKTERLLSLDALRGFDLFWIVGGHGILLALFKLTEWGWLGAIDAQLKHVDWNGFQAYDLIFPLFLFMAGVSTPYSLTRRLAEGARGEVIRKVIQRGLILVLLGIIYNNGLQWKGLEANGQFRFTPPTHALVAFPQAMKEHAEEGGVAARGARYQKNAQILIKGMRDMGFSTLLSDNQAGPIIQTFLTPRDKNFHFENFYEELRRRGFAIYPGKLTKRPSFRIGTIGKVDEAVMNGVLKAIREVLADMNVTDMAPLEA